MALTGQSNPVRWEALLDQAEGAWREGRHHDALQLCDRAAQKGDEARYHAAFMRGELLLELGDAAGALSSFDAVADHTVADPDLDCVRGVALFELCRFPEADNALRSALRGNPNLAEAHYTLGLLAELLGTGSEVDHLRQARKLDAKAYPATPQMPRADFEGVVSEALATLPEPVRSATQNIPVLVAEVPHPHDLTQSDPPLSPRILGLFVGTPPAELSTLDAPPVEQPTILLFKRNLERVCPDRATLIAEIRTTVLHEVGHALGLSEEELFARGLE